MARSSTVVVDTNVFSADLLRTTRPLVSLYLPLLEGPARRCLLTWWQSGGILRHPVQAARADQLLSPAFKAVSGRFADLGICANGQFSSEFQ